MVWHSIHYSSFSFPFRRFGRTNDVFFSPHLGVVVEFAIILLFFGFIFFYFFISYLGMVSVLFHQSLTPISAALNAKCSLFIQIYRRILHFFLYTKQALLLSVAVLFENLDKYFARKSNNNRKSWVSFSPSKNRVCCEKAQSRSASLWIIF